MKNKTVFITLALIFSVFALFSFNCGGSDSEDNDGDDKKASFDGTIDGETASNEQEQATENQFGAQIAGSVIQIYLVPSASSLIHITGETSETVTLPGNLTISELTYADTAGAYLYKSGTVNLDKCPGAIGDVFTGKLDVVVENTLDSSTKTIKANFSVTVYNVASPSLNCESGSSDDVPACGYSAERCEGGVCCPFVECYNACFIKDCLSTCENVNEMMECMNCMTNCANVECSEHMTSDCETAYGKLNECMDTNECGDDLIEDENIECSRTNCCSELEAAFKG